MGTLSEYPVSHADENPFRLVNQPPFPKVRPKPQPERKRVTVIIGIICDDAVVMASDTQTTIGTLKRSNTNKLQPVRFKNGHALIGEAGHAHLSGNAVQHMQLLGPLAEIVDEQTVQKTAEDAMQRTRETLRRQNFMCSGDDLNAMLRGPGQDCHWLVSHFYKGQPQMFKLHLSTATSFPVKGRFACVGTGSELSSYLLERLLWPTITPVEAATIAAYVIEQTKNHIEGCGGKTNIAVITEEDVLQYGEEHVRRAANMMAEADAAIKTACQIAVQRFLDDAMLDLRAGMTYLARFARKHPEAGNWGLKRVCKAIESENPKLKAQSLLNLFSGMSPMQLLLTAPYLHKSTVRRAKRKVT
jgi:20S proteasome alpha/beta subunit